MECTDKTNGGCSLDMGRGCRFCNCGEEASASVCQGCFKLHTTDWLEGLPEVFENDIYEVRFKNTRRGYYKNVNNLPLQKGDIVAVEASPGHDIGIVSLTGDMVARQMKRVGFNPLNGEFRKIYRKAKPYDIEKWQEAIAQEHETMIRSRQIAAEMGLNMKIGDVEYQGDKIKAIFYYIADERVDFRELIKVFADQFRIRVEMKQIGARQEAGRIGGLGSCGRELCCASWISSFVSVTTNAARTQEISLNPQKLAGQCSKLKCCMIYELDTYIDARKDLPKVNQPLQTIDGDWFLVKTDILARTMGFSTSPYAMAGLVTLPVERVEQVMEMNRKGKKPDRLESENAGAGKVVDPGFVNMVGEESITRFDSVRGEKRSKSRRKKSGGEPGGEKTKTAGSSHGQKQGSGGGRNRKPQEGGPSAENRQSRQPKAEGSGKDPGRQRPPRKEGSGGGNRQPNQQRTEPGNEPRQPRQARGEGGASENRQPRQENGENRNRPSKNRNNRGRGNSAPKTDGDKPA